MSAMFPIHTPRIGLGIDMHRLEAGRPCTLGGVTMESAVGPVGHSDGDAILHAVCDACLGAAGLDDLGTLFPDHDERNKGRPSSEFCLEAMRRVAGAGLHIVGIDVVVECERPKIAAHRAAIRAQISSLFQLPMTNVNVKGKTGEGVDAVGRGEAIRVTAVALAMTPYQPQP